MPQPPSRWTAYPDLVQALHTRDWATVATLYENGAPGSALFPSNVGQTSLDPRRARPDDGVLNLPAVMLYAHGMYQEDSVHDRSILPDVIDDDELQTIRRMVQAWQAAGGVWDDVGAFSEPARDDAPVWYRSLSALTEEHMTPEAPTSWSFVHFEADIQPWLETFLEWGWKPQPSRGVPMVHRALLCGRVGWAQTLLDQADPGEDWARVVRDRLDNSPLHALAKPETHAWTDDRVQDRREWLGGLPEAAWHQRNANGHTPVEHWLMALNLEQVDEGLTIARENGWALNLDPEVRDQAMERSMEQGTDARLGKTMVRWETMLLRQGLPADSALGARSARRL